MLPKEKMPEILDIISEHHPISGNHSEEITISIDDLSPKALQDLKSFVDRTLAHGRLMGDGGLGGDDTEELLASHPDLFHGL